MAAGIERPASRSRVDGVVAEERHLRGKPAPDTFLEAARVARRPARAGGGLRGRARRRAGRARRRLRLRRGRRPRRPARRAARPRRRPSWSTTSPSCSVIAQPHFSVEPWAVREERPRPRPAGPGRVGVRALQRPHRAARQPRRGRAVRDARAPTSTASTRSARCRTPRRATAIPEDGQTVVNVTNGKIIRLLVDDEPFDVRYGTLVSHDRTLDLRAGVLRREVALALAGGARDRGELGAPRVLRAPLGGRDPLRGRAARRGDAGRAAVGAGRQRGRAAAQRGPARGRDRWPRRWSRSSTASDELRAVLVHSTRESALRMAAGMDHVVDGPTGTVTENESFDDLARVTVSAEVGHGETLTLTKFLAYGWSSQRSMVSIRDQVDAGAGVGAAHRLRRPARRPARVPRRLLGARRRRDRRRRRAPAGRALRPLPHAAVRRPRARSARSPPRG